jgi:hypothetical protein
MNKLESYCDVTIRLIYFWTHCDVKIGLAKFEIIMMSQFKELESYCDVTIGLIYF